MFKQTRKTKNKNKMANIKLNGLSISIDDITRGNNNMYTVEVGLCIHKYHIFFDEGTEVDFDLSGFSELDIQYFEEYPHTFFDRSEFSHLKDRVYTYFINLFEENGVYPIELKEHAKLLISQN